MRKGTLKDIPEIQLLWQEVFGDSETYVNSFISHFGIENCYLCEENSEIVAMAFALPTNLSLLRVPLKIRVSALLLFRSSVLPLFYLLPCIRKLRQKPYIVFKKEADVVDFEF